MITHQQIVNDIIFPNIKYATRPACDNTVQNQNIHTEKNKVHFCQSQNAFV